MFSVKYCGILRARQNTVYVPILGQVVSILGRSFVGVYSIDPFHDVNVRLFEEKRSNI